MDRLWAPWRKTYIRPNGKKTGGCLFCRILSQKKDAQNYILKRSSFSFAVLNIYPYNNGHVMILPNRHTSSLTALSPGERLDLLGLMDEMIQALQREFKAQGFNVGVNLGKAAGAGIPHHIHLHLVPRWVGDSNFMTTVSKTRVISESLDSSYRTLARAVKGKAKSKKSKRARTPN